MKARNKKGKKVLNIGQFMCVRKRIHVCVCTCNVTSTNCSAEFCLLN